MAPCATRDFVALGWHRARAGGRSWPCRLLGLRGDLARRFALAGFHPRTAIKRGADPIRLIGVLGKPKRLDGRRHAAGDDFAQRRADIGGSEKRKQRADHGQARRQAERQIQPRADRAQPGERAEPAANAAEAQSRYLPRGTADLVAAKARWRASSLPRCHLDQAHDRFERSIGLQDREEDLIRALIAGRPIFQRDAAEIERSP